MINKLLYTRHVWTLSIYLVLLIFLIYRAYFVAYVSESPSGYSFSTMMLKTLGNDLFIIGFILSLEIFSAAIRLKYLSMAAKSIIALLIFAYITDVLVFKYLANRFNIDDVLIYGKEFSVIGEIASTVSSTKFGMVSLLLLLILVISTPFFILATSSISSFITRLNNRNTRFIFLSASILLASAILFYETAPAKNGNLHLVRTGNLFYALSSYSYKNEYSNDFIEKQKIIRREIHDSMICSNGRDDKRNVILIMVESLSSYHSKFTSGIRDYTPVLDRIAADNISFKNFHANGFTTVGGYMSILNGLLPVPKTTNQHTTARGGWVALSGFENNPFSKSLPAIYNDHGFKTMFISNGDLEFAGSYEWLKNIGFASVEDARSPEFDGQPRFLFNAPSDKALFELAEKRISGMQDNYFLALSTISTHRPYIDIKTGEVTNEETAFRQTDMAIGEFYNHLVSSGYFNNGILLITGDHRAMTPPVAEEQALYGENTGDRIPLILIDKLSGNHVIEDHYQQIDIFNSLKTLVSTESCRIPLYGNFYESPMVAPECILFARGDNRNVISVSCGRQQADILLSGNDTRSLAPALDNEAYTINFINSLRLF